MGYIWSVQYFKIDGPDPTHTKNHTFNYCNCMMDGKVIFLFNKKVCLKKSKSSKSSSLAHTSLFPEKIIKILLFHN